MSDITPADALRELGDDQAEYAAAAAKKLGLPETLEEWEWSPGDVVLEHGSTVYQRHGYGYYPWYPALFGCAHQRDQDITDLVTKHGGRVLVCKARGIGGAR